MDEGGVIWNILFFVEITGINDKWQMVHKIFILKFLTVQYLINKYCSNI